MSDFQLTDGERAHPLWLKLKAHWLDRIAELRQRNDRTLSEAETAALRGQIAELKVAVALGDERPITPQ
jgi:hypothetical protein